MIDVINDEFGTEYEYEDPWERVLAPGTLPTSPPPPQGGGEGPGSPRAAPLDLGRLDGLLAGADLPSEDEEDEDYECAAAAACSQLAPLLGLPAHLHMHAQLDEQLTPAICGVQSQ
jgi:hypothetical protein